MGPARPDHQKIHLWLRGQDIADKASVRVALVEQARPYLEELGEQLDEDIFLGMCTGTQLLILDQVESSKELKIRARPGTRISKLAGAGR